MIWGVLGSGLVVDLLASSILTYYLKRSRTGWTRYALLGVSGTGFFSDGHARFFRTDSIIDIMMVYAINTGVFGLR